jgi:dihydropteroate synthase
MTRIVGILNVTRDSFSDGGRFLDPAAAIEHGLRLRADGADVVDVGAEATNPDAEDVPAEVESTRLAPVVEHLKAAGVRLSIDTHKPGVMRRMLALGADMINDVAGFADPASVDAVRESAALLVVMHACRASALPSGVEALRGSECPAGGSRARAERIDVPPAGIVDRILDFLRRRTAALIAAGIRRERIVIDPGMGLFLGLRPEASLAVLRGLPSVAALGFPVMVSVSRKAFVGDVLSAVDTGAGPASPPPTPPRVPVGRRGAGTLAAELWAARHGAAYIRTHDVLALRQALTIDAAIRAAPDAGN